MLQERPGAALHEEEGLAAPLDVDLEEQCASPDLQYGLDHEGNIGEYRSEYQLWVAMFCFALPYVALHCSASWVGELQERSNYMLGHALVYIEC